MMEKDNIKTLSDLQICQLLGHYIKHQRLEQNKSQAQLAAQAGINRSTLVELEKGKPMGMMTLIQLLRALKLLALFEQFKISLQPSPLLVAKTELTKRKRASSKTKTKLPSKKRLNTNW